MSTAIETAVAKFAVAFVAVAMMFSLVAPAAQAQTVEELQAMINDLLAQVAALEGTTGGGVDAPGVCPYTWTRDLGTGSSGMDVMKLQQFLNADPETRVAASGVGSAGMETEYYGGLTAAAVSKFQTKYRSEVLTPLGLVNPTGYFGAGSRSVANDLCTTPAEDPSLPGDEDGTDDEDEDEDEMEDEDLSGGEASLEDFDLRDGDDTNLREGQENAPVAEIEFDVEDGDVNISRVDVAFDPGAGNDEDDPWDTFETVSLWVDGDMIAEMEADDEDEWEEDEPNTGDYRLRFTGLDVVVREGDTAEMIVGVSVNSSVDGADDGETWDVFVPNDGIRGRDGAGVDQYTGDTSDTVDFDIEEEGADDELLVKSSTNDPDATTLQVEDDSKSDWITVFAFDLDSDDSNNDIEVDDLQVDIDATEDGSAGTSTNLLINDVRLVVDGDEIGDLGTVTHGTTGLFPFSFDNNEFVIDAGDRVEVEVQVEFVQLPSTLEGATVQASTDASTGYDVEGADDVTPTGSATGDEHTLRTSGAILELVSADETFEANTDSLGDEEGNFDLVFDVTAFEQDVFIDDSAVRGTSFAGNEGANFQVITGGTATTAGTAVVSLDSDADVEGGFFRVSEGNTERFTLTVDYDPNITGFYKVQLYSVNYAATATTPDTEQRAIPASDFDTDPLSI